MDDFSNTRMNVINWPHVFTVIEYIYFCTNEDNILNDR